MAGYSVFRHADTEVDEYFIVEDNICCLIINVKPGLKLIKVLLPIVLPSSPAIANTFVGCRYCFREFISSSKKANNCSFVNCTSFIVVQITSRVTSLNFAM